MHILEKIVVLSIVLLWQVSSNLYADDSVFEVNPSLQNESIGKYLEILEDKNGTLTIDDVSKDEMASRFFQVGDEEPGFGFSSSAYWVKLSVKNQSAQAIEWYMEIAYPLIDTMYLYIPDSLENFVVKKAGDHFPFNYRELLYRNIIFPLYESPQSQKTYYLRFKTSSSMNMPITFWTQDALFEKTNSEQILLGIFFGAIVIMIIYNLFLFFGFRDISYIYYVIFLSLWGLSQLTINGLAFQYLWPEAIWWAYINLPVLIFASMTTTIQFCRTLLEMPEKAPRWDKVLVILIFTFFLGMVLSLIVDYSLSIKLAAASAIVDVLALTISGVISMKKGSRPAKFFLTAWGFFLIGVVLFSLKSFGLVPGNFVTNWSIQIGAFALMVLFSIAVQDRVKIEKRDKYLAQKSSLETLKKSERLLEEKVAERTKELFDKNVTLKKSTEEQQDLLNELDTLDNIVKTINREIEFSNVLNALLEQGLKLLPQAMNGAALIFNPETEKFHFMASSGYDIATFKKQTMSTEEIRGAFKGISEEVIKGIYIISNKEITSKSVVFGPTKSRSVLAMSISLDGQLAGFLLFDNNKNPDAFDHSDAQKMSRFRSHAASAFAKAQLLQEMKKVTEEIVKAQDQLIVQEKMASLGQLTAGIAHEIKNPLNFVNNFAEGSVELSEDLIEQLNKQKENLNKDDFEELEELINDLKQNALDIRDNGKRADSIVRSMMDHASGSSDELRLVDINKLLEENVNLAYHGYRANDSSFNIIIEKNYDNSLPELEILQADIGRVLLNIINNACYALSEKQKEMGEDFNPLLSISTKANIKTIDIRIRDNGNGIPEKIREKIFNPFFTTKPTGTGNSGLGLSISYDIIVLQHYGKLTVDSKPGEFTEFVITLPADTNA